MCAVGHQSSFPPDYSQSGGRRRSVCALQRRMCHLIVGEEMCKKSQPAPAEVERARKICPRVQVQLVCK